MMERLGTEQRIKVVQFYFESQDSTIQTQRLYLTAPDFFLWG